MNTKTQAELQVFTEQEIEHLTQEHNWELVCEGDDLYLLRQKDRHYMTTVSFSLPESVAAKFLRRSA